MESRLPESPSPTNSAVKLAEPGAGLPFLELQIARLRFALARKRGNRTVFREQVELETKAIQKLVAGTDEEQRAVPVLIPRPRGLEDSSRNWSIWMTLDHLRITNSVFSMVMKGLASGRVPQREASTAAVKPSPEVKAEVESAFLESCEKLLEIADSIPDLKTEAKYAHPWFGPLDAEGWFALAAFHLKLHRGQIQSIRERLTA